MIVALIMYDHNVSLLYQKYELIRQSQRLKISNLAALSTTVKIKSNGIPALSTISRAEIEKCWVL